MNRPWPDRIQHQLRRVVGPGLIATLTLWAPTWAVAADADALLETIRQTLLAEAIDGGVTVLSAGYVDAQGRLVESSFFETHASVRGVRVKSYLEEAGDRLDHQPAVLPPVLRAGATCHAPVSGYRPHLRVTVERSRTQAAHQRVPLEAVHAAVGQRLALALTAGEVWVPTLNDPRSGSLNTYGRLVTGFKEPPADHEVVVELAIAAPDDGLLTQPRRIAVAAATVAKESSWMPLRFAARYPRESLVVTLSLVDRASGVARLREQHRIPIPGTDVRLRGGDAVAGLVPALEAVLLGFADQVNASVDCRQAMAQVWQDRSTGQPVLTVNLGARNGVVPGARFLLSGADLTARSALLDPQELGRLAIAEVTSVDADAAQLQVVAGGGRPEDYRYAAPF